MPSPFSFAPSVDDPGPIDYRQFMRPGVPWGSWAPGAGGDDAARQAAFEAAALRMRNAVKPPGGRQDSGAADVIENMVIPGKAAAQAALQGNYGEAGMEAAASALPALRFLPPSVKSAIGRTAGTAGAAVLGAGAVMPSDTPAEETKFPFIDDSSERKAADARYSAFRAYSTDPKTGRQSIDRAKTAAGRDAMVVQEQDRARQHGEEARSLEDFEATNAPAVAKLTPDQQAYYRSINAPGDTRSTIMNRQDYLQRVSAERDKAAQGFTERWPEATTALQAGSAVAGAYIPGSVLARRAGLLRQTAQDAEDAFKAASRGRASMAAKANMNLQANKVEGYQGLSALDKTELALSPTIPFVSGTLVPNTIDMARLQQHPEYPAYQHAVEMLNPTSPAAWQNAGRSLAEGLGATAVGAVGGGAIRNFPEAYTRAGSALRTIREMQDAEQAAQAARLKAKPRAVKPFGSFAP